MSNRSKGLAKERSLAGILTGLGYKVQRAPPKLRFTGGDLFGCIDMIALRKGTPPLFIQAGDSANGSHKRREIETELLPFLGFSTGSPRILLFLWGRTRKDGYRWAVDELFKGKWSRFGIMKMDGSILADLRTFRRFMSERLAEAVPGLRGI